MWCDTHHETRALCRRKMTCEVFLSTDIEGRSAAWLTPAEAQTVVVAVEQAANRYQSQNPGKGKHHPVGPRKVTLAAGLLNAHPVISLAKADQQQHTIIARQDTLPAIVNKLAKHRDVMG